MNRKPWHVIFGCHGIMTGFDNWIDRFRSHCAARKLPICVEDLDYGIVSPMRLRVCGWVSPFAWRIFDGMARQIRETMAYYPPETTFSLVGHSWGTWRIHGCLERNPDIQPRNVVLIGSVLREKFSETSFPKIIARKQIQKLQIYWSPQDEVIRDLSWYPYGKLGYRGFVDKVPDCVEMFETHESHGGYFHMPESERYFSEIAKACINQQRASSNDNPITENMENIHRLRSLGRQKKADEILHNLHKKQK